MLRTFGHGGRLRWPLLLIFLVINTLVLVNVCRHAPEVGYDAQDHWKYVKTLATGRLPSPADSLQFFAPPLPYLVPAVVWRLTGNVVMAGKAAQAVNGLLSLALTWLVLQIGRLLSPRPALRLGALAFLGVLPVYYKMFAFVRGEPYVAVFTVLAAYQTMSALARRPRLGGYVRLGVSLGLCALSRQLGLLMFPAVGLAGGWKWLKERARRRGVAVGMLASMLIGVLLGGWFFVALKLRSGYATAFNLPRARRFSFRNQPASFYTALSPRALFTHPVRPAFTNQFLPIFYSEVWGDYWGYFAVAGRDRRTGKPVSGFRHIKAARREHRPAWLETNYDVMPAYLGRVNRAGLYPTALGLVALATALVGVCRRSAWHGRVRRRDRLAFLLLVVAANLAGYLWFVVMHPTDGPGLRIRAGHLLQVYPVLAVLVGCLLEGVDRRARLWYRVLLIGLVAVFMHNVGALVTHYPRRVSQPAAGGGGGLPTPEAPPGANGSGPMEGETTE